jgi:hypothetical protein
MLSLFRDAMRERLAGAPSKFPPTASPPEKALPSHDKVACLPKTTFLPHPPEIEKPCAESSRDRATASKSLISLNQIVLIRFPPPLPARQHLRYKLPFSLPWVWTWPPCQFPNLGLGSFRILTLAEVTRHGDMAFNTTFATARHPSG